MNLIYFNSTLLFLNVLVAVPIHSMIYFRKWATACTNTIQYTTSTSNELYPKEEKIVKFLFKKTIGNDSLNILTQTPLHLWLTRKKMDFNFNTFCIKPELNVILQQVLEKEQLLHANYYTFVHGQQRKYYWPERLYTFLWSVKKKRPISDFFFAHVKDLIQTPEGINYEKNQKNILLNMKTTTLNNDQRKLILFMNYALFANIGDPGRNSASYIIDNYNENSIYLPAIESFKKLGYEHIYHQFSYEIDSLEKDYKEGRYGNLLFIAVPKKDIHHHVYLAHCGIRFVNIKNIGPTSDIRIIMDNLTHHPENVQPTDFFEFCLIMTQKDGGLDPDSGIKIFPILSGDPAKLAELKAREEILLAKIKEAIEKEEHDKIVNAAHQRAAMIVQHLVPEH